MKIKFLGSGSAFVNHVENYQSNILIQYEDHNLLYDCGTSINDALHHAKMEASDIDSIYISHLHADHAGGVEFMAFKTYFSPAKKPELIGHEYIIKKGWENTWSGGLASLQDSQASLDTYFDVTTHTDISNFYIKDIKFTPIRTPHVVSNGLQVPSYGLGFVYNDQAVFITGDTQYSKELFNYYAESDIIFQDCEFADYPGGVHAQFHQLKELPAEIKAKMWLYHYALNGKHIWEYDIMAEKAGFAGVVRRGQEFDLEDVYGYAKK